MEEREANATSLELRQAKVDVASSSGYSNGSMNFPSSDSKPSVYTLFIAGVDFLNHVLILLLTVFTLYFALQTVSSYRLHVALCTLGYILLLSEAIVVFTGDGVLSSLLTHRGKKHLHWILQLLGLVCIIVGVWFIYQLETIHFRTTHSILGITSLVVMIFVTVFGYPVFIAGKLSKWVRPVTIKFGHNFLGLASFVIGMASQCYGYKYRVTDISKEVNFNNVCIVVTCVITFLSVRRALPTLFQQFLRLFK
ncbi:PREDICTED: cytochrome b561 domain-containing protein 2-like [Eufriesea mexicana]|uniref:cytochrome b561 domain-containing protein 2-like n=1 Tax=Eufriesea mexicana TaxID=516756 RepID=UPI00083C2E6A|nr:PREDICTED: cytochrome b561 domain-containing protein 2-like [Eufriesea mexicana]